MSNTVAILSNLIPLAGVAWFGWNSFDLLALYWIENLVVLAFVLWTIRIVNARGQDRISPREIEKFYTFFLGFALIFGVFIFVFPVLFLRVPFDFWQKPHMVWAAAGLVVSHAVTFVEHTMTGPRSRRVTLSGIVDRAMLRIPAMVFGTVVGIMTLVAFGTATSGLVVLVLLKIGFEVSFHRGPRKALSVPSGQ